MKTNRRNFVKTLGAASIAAAIPAQSFSSTTAIISPGSGKLKLSFEPYNLELKHTFTVAGFSRDTTPVVLTQLEHEGIVGYGEASMPPYLGESQKSVTTFLRKVDLSQFNDRSYSGK